MNAVIDQRQRPAGHRPRLALGPVLYYWPREQLEAFYAEVSQWPVDVVYLGESVCAKRRSFGLDDWLAIAQRLEDAGIEVVLSTLTLIEAESELKTLRRICTNGRFTVEANDLGAVRLAAGSGTPFVTGPAVNIYNPRTLRVLAEQGLRRWSAPLELSGQAIAAIQARRPPGVETEVFAFGRMPLAYSARCFTARAANRPKDDCGYLCLDDPDGRLVRTQEDAPFVALNGVQTQSAPVCNLLPEIETLGEIGVDVLRISPQSRGTQAVLAAFQACLERRLAPAEAMEALRRAAPFGFCDGYWRGEPGAAASC